MNEAQEVTSVVLAHAAGLHARPSLKLTMLAKTFSSKIELALQADGPWIDAKSIVKIMATKAPRDSVLYLRANGADAETALKALVDLVNRDFHQDAGEAPKGVAAVEGRADG